MRTANRPSPALPAARTGEAGSAYIAVLLVLVVLTIFALALSLITQTEMQIGTNERTVNRVFYAADTGIELATAQILVSRDFSDRTYLLTDTGVQLVAGRRQFGTQVTVSEIRKAHEAPCNGCEINDQGTYGGNDYSRTIFTINATAARFSTFDAGAERAPLAQKTLSDMVAIEPIARVVVDPE